MQYFVLYVLPAATVSITGIKELQKEPNYIRNPFDVALQRSSQSPGSFH